MSHSLRVRLKNLQRKGELTEKDIDRIFKALEQEPCDDDYQTDMDEAWKQAKREPCDDVVSREDAIAEINDTIARYIPLFYGRTVKIPLELDRAIMRVPPVRPQEPKTGHWTRQDNTKEPLYGWYFCSECNSVIGDKTKFCSNCGAKMVEPQERSKE